MDGAGLALESCAKTLAFGDGRDLFTLQPAGQLAHIPSGKCVSVSETGIKEDALVSLASCDSASRWEVQSNGQFKMKSTGDFCLTQEGAAPGLQDVAANAAATASSTVNAASHGQFCFDVSRFTWSFFGNRGGEGRGRANENVLGVKV